MDVRWNLPRVPSGRVRASNTRIKARSSKSTLRMIGSSLYSPPAEPKRLDPEDQTMNYQWPASRLTRADMIRLSELKNKLRRPITKLLHEAVKAYYDLANGTLGE